jgi:sarcosine oxidase subunit beta
MMAPFAGEVLAENVAEDKVHPLMKPYLPTRFKEGKEIKETMVIG